MTSVRAIPVREDNPVLDGIHLQWLPTVNGYHSVSGFSVWRRSASEKPKVVCEVLDNRLPGLYADRLLDFKLGQVVYAESLSDWAKWHDELRQFLDRQGVFSGDVDPVLFHFRFQEPLWGLEFTLMPTSSFLIAVALRNGAAIESRILTNANSVTLKEASDEVRLYVQQRPTALRVCYQDWSKSNEKSWQLLVKNLHLPFETVNPGVVGADAEWSLIRSRAPNDTFGDGDFAQLSLLLNRSLDCARKTRLPIGSVYCAVETESSDTGRRTELHFSPWNWLLGLTIRPAWRRGLGFAFQDQAELLAGKVYDYKVQAVFSRQALGEQVLDFHTVPLNTQIGPSFALRDVLIHSDSDVAVQAFPFGDRFPGGVIYQKGIQVQSWLRIAFPAPVQRLVIFSDPEFGGVIDLPELGMVLPLDYRIDVTLPTPVLDLVLHGRFALTGIAVPALAPSIDPDGQVEITNYVYGVVFQNTPRLDAPDLLTAANLQSEWLPGSTQPPEGLGFRLSWSPPFPTAHVPPALWLPDCPAPPIECVAFQLEHWDVTTHPTTPEWEPYDIAEAKDADGLVVPYRGIARSPAPVTYGADLLAVFPAEATTLTDYDPLQSLAHVLSSPARQSDVKPGSLHCYRIWSLDAIGRRSPEPTLSSTVLVEKRMPPPSPAGIETALRDHPTDSGYVLADLRTDRPKGVYVRVLQATDPYSTATERALLAGRSRLTIISWAWGQEESRLDPWVREFRIYWCSQEQGRLTGSFTAMPTAVGSHWQIAVSVSHAVNTNEFTGVHIYLGSVPFFVVNHTAGVVITMELAPPLTRPAEVPQPGTFTMYRKSRGEAARPTAWEMRIATVAIAQQQVYQYVLETGSLLSSPNLVQGTPGNYFEISASGAAVHGWLGVSAADREPYVPDQFPGGTRSGNESGIVTAVVRAAYYGRPEFSPPAPLTDVPVTLLDEVESDEVLLSLDLARELAGIDTTGYRVRVERISAAELLPLLRVTATSVGVADANDEARVQAWALTELDVIALRNQLSRGSQFIDAKFFWAIASGSFSHERLWRIITPQPVEATATISDRLPNKAERYIYRVRLADTAGRVSARSAYLPQVWRSPDKTLPPEPALPAIRFQHNEDMAALQTDIQLQAALSGAVKGVLVFAGTVANSAAGRELLAGARLVKIPNRPDLPSEIRTRLSLPDGQLLEPLFLSKSASVQVDLPQTSVLVWSGIQRNVTYGQLAAIWAATVSEDNILSGLVMSRFIVLPPRPPIAPPFTIALTNEGVSLHYRLSVESWLVRVERSDNGAVFTPITAWHPARDTEGVESLAAPPLGVSRRYRLRVRDVEGQETVGEPSEPIEGIAAGG